MLDGLVIRDATGSGIQLETAANCALSNLMVTASATGITVKDSPWLNVGHSSFSGNTGNGLLMERSNDCRFDYVDINRNNNGIGGSESARICAPASPIASLLETPTTVSRCR